MITVYKLTNNVNGKIYIGQTSLPLGHRFSKHCWKSSTTAIGKDIVKYGKINFLIEPLKEVIDQEDADFFEDYFIRMNMSSHSHFGYNIRLGGKHAKRSMFNPKVGHKIGTTKAKGRVAHNKGVPHKLEAKVKISMTSSAHMHTDEAKKRMSLASKGKPKSEAHKRKMSKFKKGQPSHNKYTGKVLRSDGVVYVSVDEASLDLDVKRNFIMNVMNGNKKSAKGYGLRKHE